MRFIGLGKRKYRSRKSKVEGLDEKNSTNEKIEEIRAIKNYVQNLGTTAIFYHPEALQDDGFAHPAKTPRAQSP
jgi:hypothetical protein